MKAVPVENSMKIFIT